MLQHGTDSEILPSRVVVIGADGFVGNAICTQVAAEGVDVLRLGRAEVDLLAPGAAMALDDVLRPGDAVVAASAIAPTKSLEMLQQNLVLFGAIAEALAARGDDITHVLNISSDAVFGDTPTPLNETSALAPESYHGLMHLSREVHFKTTLTVPLASLRPTLIYGAQDPHNGYGPNKFRRQAAAGEDIRLFGEGEELRDHVLIDDVAALAWLILKHRSHGALNAVTGHVTSFRDIAEMVVGHFDKPVAIAGSPRSGPMPHNGFRPFEISACQRAFPMFRFTPIAEGLKRVHQAEFGGV
tara:strand:+ start:13555 stop:14448 length:894 start_codon:yes stop_codon:yes gene_type:complete